MDNVHDHIWDAVNAHLGTSAQSFPELVEQLGMMRFGHRPRVADTFCGSGQIPFEAARLGCDVYASDLNPVACMLTWGAFHIVGAQHGEPRDDWEVSSENFCSGYADRLTSSVSRPTAKAGKQRYFSIVLKPAARKPAGWYLCCRRRIVSKGHRAIVRVGPGCNAQALRHHHPIWGNEDGNGCRPPKAQCAVTAEAKTHI